MESQAGGSPMPGKPIVDRRINVYILGDHRKTGHL
jgi:hypothetical protein